MTGQLGKLTAIGRSGSTSLKVAVLSGVRVLKRWHGLGRQRRQLASLSDAALKDLGLSRADIAQETQRPFWDDPFAR
jgi:uncharacterized protein YjiS (DUF1127 family)